MMGGTNVNPSDVKKAPTVEKTLIGARLQIGQVGGCKKTLSNASHWEVPTRPKHINNPTLKRYLSTYTAAPAKDRIIYEYVNIQQGP